jgi:hypothetical protein
MFRIYSFYIYHRRNINLSIDSLLTLWLIQLYIDTYGNIHTHTHTHYHQTLFTSKLFTVIQSFHVISSYLTDILVKYAINKHTGYFLYGCPEHITCHVMGRQIMAFVAIKLPSSVQRQKEDSVYTEHECLWTFLSLCDFGILLLPPKSLLAACVKQTKENQSFKKCRGFSTILTVYFFCSYGIFLLFLYLSELNIKFYLQCLIVWQCEDEHCVMFNYVCFHGRACLWLKLMNPDRYMF